MGFFSIEELGFWENKEPTGKHHFIEKKKKEEWKRQALHSIAFEIDPQHTLILTTQKACGIYYTYVPQHTIPFRSFRVSRAYHSSQIIHTLVVTTCALYDILLLRITSSSSLAPPLPPFLQPPSSLLHPSLRTRVQPYISSLMIMAFVAYLFPCFIYTESGPGLRESGFCFFYLSFYFNPFFSFLSFSFCSEDYLPYLTILVCFTFWFGSVLVLVLVFLV